MQPSSDDDDNNAVAMKAMLTAVENGSSSPNGERDEYGCQGLIRLFQTTKQRDSIVAGHTAKEQRTLLCNSLISSNKGQLKRFFTNVRSIVERIIEEDAFLPDSSRDNGAGNSDPDEQRSTECLLFLKYVVLCLQTVLDDGVLQQQQQQHDASSSKRPLKMLSQVFELASALHEILFTLHAGGPDASSLKFSVLNLCQSWWFANVDRREALIVQCLPLLVIRACEEDDCFTNKAHIQRLSKLRDAFHCIDFADPSSDSLRLLLLRVSSNPLCLKTPEGKKFLASLLQDADLVNDLHLSFRVQIPEAKDSLLQAYGEIYLRAWKEAKESSQDDENVEDSNEDIENKSIRQTIEHEVLQDLMYAAIHVASPKTLQGILTVLDPFHADKKNKDVATMLYELYSPILWRSLTAANPSVRQNALIVLERVFPLHNPSVLRGQNTMKEAVLKGTQALQSALKDVDSAVRVAASKATGKIFATFWDAFPPQTIRSILNLIIIEHSSDKTSAAVRASAVVAVTNMLGAKQSHGVLRTLLPSLGNLIHDRSEKVRLAVVKMLIRVKHIVGIRFYHVVPVDQLLARFVAENESHRNPRNSMVRELTALMLNSYFPQKKDISASQQLKRTLTFLLSNPTAASVFYSNLADHLDVESMVKFILQLSTCLKTAVEEHQASQVRKVQQSKKRHHHRSTKQAQHSERNDEDNTDDHGSSESISADNTALMASLSSTINVLWESISDSLEKQMHHPNKKLLEERFSGKELNIVTILSHFEEHGFERRADDGTNIRRIECFQTCSALLSCASRLDRKSISEIIEFVSSSLKKISKEKSQCLLPLVTSYMRFMCSLGYVDEVAASLSNSIKASLGEETLSLLSPTFDETRGSHRSRRSSLKKSSDNPIPILLPAIAWPLLDGILQGTNSDYMQIRQAILNSDTATSSLLKAFEKGIKLAEQIVGSSDDSFGRSFTTEEVECTIRASEAYGRFALHKQSSASLKNENQVVLDGQVRMLLNWTTDIIVPALLRSDQGASILRDLDLSHISNVSDSLVHLPPGSPSLTSPPKRKPNLGRTPESMRCPSSMSERNPTGHSVIFSEKVATSLLMSSCMIVSELLAMGVSHADDIAKAAVEWCTVLENSEVSLNGIVFPAFLRLAFQLNRASGDCTVLENLLVTYNDYTVSEKGNVFGEMKQVLLSILRHRGQGPQCVVSLFLAIVNRLITDDEEESPAFEIGASLTDIWEKGGCIAMFLEIVEGNQMAQRWLAKKLVTSLSSSDGVQSPIALFQAKCLAALTNTLHGNSMSAILQELDSKRFQGESDIQVFVENLLESSV